MLLDSFKAKFLVATLIAIVAVFYQLTIDDDILVVEKAVVVAKSPLNTFEFLTRLDDYPAVSAFLAFIWSCSFLSDF